jgi:hypothetical protein
MELEGGRWKVEARRWKLEGGAEEKYSWELEGNYLGR